jgi:hypothetical protein
MTLELQDQHKKIGIIGSEASLATWQPILETLLKLKLNDRHVIVSIESRFEKQGTVILLNKNTHVQITVKYHNTIEYMRSHLVGDFLMLLSKNSKISFSIRPVIDIYELKKPDIIGEFQIKETTSNNFNIRNISNNSFQDYSLKSFGIEATEAELLSPLKVVMNPEAYNKLIVSRQYSMLYEEGGFFAGDVYNDTDKADCFIIHITDVIEAKHVAASAYKLIFTGETFSELKKVLRSDEMLGKKLLGWYHTHLFSANNSEISLSSTDLNLHFTTFRFSWQVAGLINLEMMGANTLRFYSKKKGEEEMELNPHWIIKD